MNITLQRRLRQAEQAIDQLANPKKPTEVVLLGQPAPGDSPEVVSKFEAEKAAALERGAFLIVLTPLQPLPRQVEGAGRRAQVDDVPGRDRFEGRRNRVR